MKSISRTVVIALIYLVIPKFAYAEGDGVPSVAYLTHMSDVIVVGTASLDAQNGQTSFITINVQRIIKGKTSEIAAQLHLTDTTSFPCVITPPAHGVNAIWFLKKAADGTLRFGDTPKSQICDPFENNFEVPDSQLPEKWSYSDKARSEDKLAFEIANAIDASQGFGPYAISLSDDLFEGTGKQAGLDLFRKLASSPDTNTSMMGGVGSSKAGGCGNIAALSSYGGARI